MIEQKLHNESLIRPIEEFKEQYLLYHHKEYIGKIDYFMQLLHLRCIIKRNKLQGYGVIKITSDLSDYDIEEPNLAEMRWIRPDGKFDTYPGEDLLDVYLKEIAGF